MSVPRRARIRRSLPIAAVLAGSLTLAACLGAPAPPPPAPAPAPKPAPTTTTTPSSATSGPCQSVVTADTNPAPPPEASPTPVSAAEAEEMARQAVEASTVRTVDGEIPLVTVAETPDGPDITTTSVATVDEAADVAAARATDGPVVAVEVDSPVTALNHASNDLWRDRQWALDRVEFEEAWQVHGTTGTGVRVAVIDTGVQGNHEDLAGQVLQGREFLGQGHQDVAGGTNDPDGHGTHVAGIIAAIANNGKGITGAAPEVKIIPVTVLCPGTGGSTSDVAKGIRWAADPTKGNVDVINLSLGGGSSTSMVRSALAYAESQGVVIVAAAGNCGQGGSNCSGVNSPSYPAAEPEAIAVAATTNTDDHASYSTSGAYVEIAAPGGASSGSWQKSVFSTWNNGGYNAIAGTSMAAPHLSAAAALLVAKGCNAAEVRSRLVVTAVDLGPEGWDPQYGAGLVNPVDALASCT